MLARRLRRFLRLVLEKPLTLSDASTVTPRRTELVTGLGVLEGECGYSPPYRGVDVGNPLM
jgi:hypothetical protein